jgi:hypothetical protein
MQPESKTSAELLERYEKNFGAAGRRRGIILLGIAGLLLIIVIGIFASSMSYVGNLNAHIYSAFDTKDQSAKVPATAK